VALAGVIAAMRITKTKLSDHKYLFQGAGEVCASISVHLSDRYRVALNKITQMQI